MLTIAIVRIVAVCYEAALFAISEIAARRVDAKKDLREVYPPKRDRFHRDLERLNKLRGTSVAKSQSQPPANKNSLIDLWEQEALTKMIERSVQSGYEYTVYWTGEEHVLQRRPRDVVWKEMKREGELRESNHLHRVVAVGISLLVPFLVIALYGAMIGLLVSLL